MARHRWDVFPGAYRGRICRTCKLVTWQAFATGERLIGGFTQAAKPWPRRKPLPKCVEVTK